MAFNLRQGNFYRMKWEQQRKDREEAIGKGLCVMLQRGRRLQVTCPFNEEFVKQAQIMSGTWRAISGMWSFRIQAYPLVYKTACDIFGTNKVMGLNRESED